MSKEQQELLDEAYVNYIRNFSKYVDSLPENGEAEFIINKDKFINKCKTDSEFSEKWGLKIEERELSEEEGNEIRDMQYFKNNLHQALKGSDTGCCK